MVASAESNPNVNSHPFWYAAVIGIFHAEVQHIGPQSKATGWKTMDFLWVRWLGVEPDHPSGRTLACLPKFGFVEHSDDYAFSFLDPTHVIRGCHMIPTFAEGRTSTLLDYNGETLARLNGDQDDWVNYYVNIFADRDIYMRHLGMGVGHQGDSNAQFETPVGVLLRPIDQDSDDRTPLEGSDGRVEDVEQEVDEAGDGQESDAESYDSRDDTEVYDAF